MADRQHGTVPMHRPDRAGGLACCCRRLLVLALLPVAGAGAGTIDEARTAHAEGRFTDAADIGEALGTSQGFALAAESLTIHAYFIAEEGDREALFERAIALARKAVDTDPDNADAYLQLSRAIGRHAQSISQLEAADRGYAEKIREAIDNALRLDPDMPEAHLSLAHWHAEVVSAAGSFMAGLIYGAGEEDALASTQRALELAPDSKAITQLAALGLLVLDDSDYLETARGLLERSIGIPAKDAYERILHEKAVETLESLDAADG